MRGCLFYGSSTFVDVLSHLVLFQDGKLVEDAQDLLAKLRDDTVPSVLPSHLIEDYSVEWGPGIDITKHEKYLKLVTICNKSFQSLSNFSVSGNVFQKLLEIENIKRMFSRNWNDCPEEISKTYIS